MTKERRGALGALFCAAGTAGDFAKMEQIAAALRTTTGSDFAVLRGLGAFFRGNSPQRYIEAFLPSVPLPLDLTYALLERYGSARASRPARKT